MGICVYWSCRHVVFVKRCNCSFYLTVGVFVVVALCLVTCVYVYLPNVSQVSFFSSVYHAIFTEENYLGCSFIFFRHMTCNFYVLYINANLFRIAIVRISFVSYFHLRILAG